MSHWVVSVWGLLCEEVTRGNILWLTDGLVCPTDKRRIEYCDTRIRGLYLEVRETTTTPGQGTYYQRYKDDTGKTCHTKIARVQEINLAEARSRAKTLKAEIQLGRNPREEAREQKQVVTWNEFFDQSYLPHIKQHKRSWRNDEEMHRLRIKDRFGQLRLDRIRKDAVVQFHAELQEEGLAPATCDHYLKLIRQALNLAVDWGLLPMNPVSKVKLFNPDNREERMMDTDQLQRLITTLDNGPDRRRKAALVVKFLLFTGARVDEALHARWKDIDRKNRTWTVQAVTSKSKRRRSIPLNDAAMAVLEQLGTGGKSEWLFVSSRLDDNGNPQRMKTINKVWQEIRKDADLEWLRLHDLRHNYASMLMNSGRTLYEVQQILGDSDSKVTERYAHLSTKKLQDAANSASEYLDQALRKAGK